MWLQTVGAHYNAKATKKQRVIRVVAKGDTILCVYVVVCEFLNIEWIHVLFSGAKVLEEERRTWKIHENVKTVYVVYFARWAQFIVRIPAKQRLPFFAQRWICMERL